MKKTKKLLLVFCLILVLTGIFCVTAYAIPPAMWQGD